PEAKEELSVRKRLLKPPGIQPKQVETCIAAGIRNRPEIMAKVSARLPHCGDVEFESRNQFRLTEVDVKASADPRPVRGIASRVRQKIVDMDHIHRNAGIRQFRARAVPIAEHKEPFWQYLADRLARYLTENRQSEATEGEGDAGNGRDVKRW